MEWSDYEVVLGVALGDHAVGVVRMPGGQLLFPGRVDWRGGVVLDGFEPNGSHVDGTMVVAGRRPAGAARVVVIDDRGDEYDATVGDEVWVAVAGEAGFSEPLARFCDATGALVARPLPDGTRTPVAETHAACPVCGAVAWVEIDERVHCERCGLQVGAGMHFMRFDLVSVQEAEALDEDEDEDEEEEDEPASAIAGAGFPIYGVPGADPQIGSYSSGDDGVHAVSVHHTDGDRVLQVETESRESWRRGWLRESLARLLDHGERGWKGSEATMRVHRADAERIARRRAALAEFTTRELVIDGQPEPFAFLGLDDVWVAERDHYGLTIQLVGRKIDPATVTLAPLTALGSASSSAERARRAAAGDLLGREEVIALIAEHGLTEHREPILAAIRPGYRLSPDPRSPHRLGGLPDLAPGERWPHDEHGIPYTFVAQIDCSQFPPLVSEFTAPEWNHGGQLLRIFAALDARVPEGGPAIAFACAPDAPLTRTEVPPRPDAVPEDAFEPDDDSLRRLEEVPVRLTPFLTAREGWSVIGDAADSSTTTSSGGGSRPAGPSRARTPGPSHSCSATRRTSRARTRCRRARGSTRRPARRSGARC